MDITMATTWVTTDITTSGLTMVTTITTTITVTVTAIMDMDTTDTTVLTPVTDGSPRVMIPTTDIMVTMDTTTVAGTPPLGPTRLSTARTTPLLTSSTTDPTTTV